MSGFTQVTRDQVVARALTQVGKPYQLYAQGPVDYDCSGSVVDAWRPYLVLPHNSGELVKWFRDASDGSHLIRPGLHDGHGMRHYLLPGDVVFYYGRLDMPDTVGHVATYVGTRVAPGKQMLLQVVNATDEQRGVELITIDAYATPVGFGFVRHELP